ncbi:hypothetical protein [Wenzhouxiangella limi]|uniref:Uncharacterized protein n=1 Tax=Wenzhouxiangella limi TaxID=2707351 RepID=A0A845UVW6_9GAMM|nr:hypothetical protein [Wenzhouxiangella limi]NDY94382.1 hypothetical protein [Wenzhouxiangella limi]
MEKVRGYKTPIWAQACMVLAGLGVVASIILAVVAFYGMQGRMSPAEAWIYVYLSAAVFLWAVPLGTLGAILAEINKYRISWSQKNGIDPEVRLSQDDISI